MTNYIDTAEVAKMVRASLKKAFPGTKFSVRSDRYAGGSSIDVRWTDGPSHYQVKNVAGHFHGTEFDGMIDLASPNGRPYLNDYIFFQRSFSPEFLNKCADIVTAEYGFARPEVKVCQYSGHGYFGHPTDYVSNAHGEYYWGNDQVAQRYANATAA